MRMCPQCGGPLPDSDVAPSSVVLDCPRCLWQGPILETIYVDDASTKVSEHQERLEQLYQRMASEVAPTIGKILIELELVPSPRDANQQVDRAKLAMLAKILQSSTRGAIEGIAKAIAGEMSHGRN